VVRAETGGVKGEGWRAWRARGRACFDGVPRARRGGSRARRVRVTCEEGEGHVRGGRGSRARRVMVTCEEGLACLRLRTARLEAEG